MACLNEKPEHFQKLYNYYNRPLNSQDLRLWKLDKNVKMQYLAKFIKGNVQNMKVSNYKPRRGDVEMNTGLQPPLESLENQQNSILENISGFTVPKESYIIVELANTQGQFTFMFKNEDEMLYDRCQYCFALKALKVSCRCKKAFYCDQTCLEKDSRFHTDKCDALQTVNDIKIEGPK